MALVKIPGYFFLFLPALSYALPMEFTATYFAETYGVTAAQATYKLEHKNNGITFTQHTELTGLAALFSDDVLDETSYLSLHNDRLLLDEYHYIKKGDKDNHEIHLNISWANLTNGKVSGTITGVASGHSVKLDTNTPVWDTLSFQIPIMMHAVEKAKPQEYFVLVKGELKTYLFITHDTEEITINEKTLKTIKIERQSGDKNKPLFLWIAPSLHNLPVKIEKWKKGKPHITMLLNSASFPSDKKIQFKAEENIDDL